MVGRDRTFQRKSVSKNRNHLCVRGKQIRKNGLNSEYFGNQAKTMDHLQGPLDNPGTGIPAGEQAMV